MTHTLWRSAEFLGAGELARGAGVDGALTGPFHPAPAFTTVWPAFHALQQATAAATRALAAAPRDAGSEEIRARLVASDPARATATALEAVAALGLEVRDAAGRTLRGALVTVAAWTVPDMGDLNADERRQAEAEAGAAGVSLDGPNYVLSVMPWPSRPASLGGSVGTI